MSKDKLIVFDKIRKGKPKKNPKTLTDQLTVLWNKVQKLKNRNERLTSELSKMKEVYSDFLEGIQLDRFHQLKDLLEHLMFLEKDVKLSSKQHQVFQAILNKFMIDALHSFIDSLGFRQFIQTIRLHEKSSKKKQKVNRVTKATRSLSILEIQRSRN